MMNVMGHSPNVLMTVKSRTVRWPSQWKKTLNIGCYFSRLIDKRQSNVLPALRPSYAACRGARQRS